MNISGKEVDVFAECKVAKRQIENLNSELSKCKNTANNQFNPHVSKLIPVLNESLKLLTSAIHYQSHPSVCDQDQQQTEDDDHQYMEPTQRRENEPTTIRQTEPFARYNLCRDETMNKNLSKEIVQVVRIAEEKQEEINRLRETNVKLEGRVKE
ncbi:uncharacterized protein LOC144747799 [Ciona intestinalis]